MNRKIVILSTIVSLAVAGGLYFGVTKSEASATPEQEAKKAVIHYLDALKSGNVDEIMKYTNDTRFKDEASQRKVYTNLAKNERVKKAEIISFEKVDDTHMNVELKSTTDKEELPQQTLPVEFLNGQWKIVIGNN
ncbi:DUF4878 domain-containing protein [Tumebacillus permanentifrigoris]|uniref:Uncharacterized protein DUF4878 n=1 Tax=Tumebacillus permanentifrigoris TaxID=378543 RepID=A0A316DBE4_9BACL|nr:DUF4878 domain-containing protein [Tumebacillus permanentifrigoris]PWK13946.1 uncharacterized protein DUF4878 [Tumebacillus permanentifrigoris]